MMRFCLILIIVVNWTVTRSTTVPEGEPRPPFLNRIVRVSRGPNVPSSAEEFNFLKSPAYQLRFRPNRLSRFHGYADAVLNGRSPSANGLSILNMPGLPGHSGIAAINPHLHGHGNLPYGRPLEELQTISSSSAEKETPTFTPLISARALSHLEKFFDHLRENINALQKDNPGGGEKVEDSLKDMDDPTDGYEDDEGRNWEESGESDFGSSFQDYLNRRGDQAVALKWQPPAAGSEKFVPSRTEEAKRIAAAAGNKFNPAWVKMGLGRRRRR